MPTATTLKLPEALKARIAPLARAEGKSPHAWMVEALEAQAELAELHRTFVEEARAAAAEIDAGGALFAMEDVHAWIRARAAGGRVPYPEPIDTPETGREPLTE